MPGAYTSTPIVTTPPSVPDGWDSDWPYPGVDPPGYDADDGEAYRLVLSAGNPGYFVPPNESCYVIAQLMEDEGLFGSVNIASDSSIEWAVTVDGEPRLFSLDGGAYGYSVSTLIGWVPGFANFGSQPLMRVDLTDSDIGLDVVVDAVATVRRDADSAGDYDTVLAQEPVSIPIAPIDNAVYTLVITSESPEDAGDAIGDELRFIGRDVGEAVAPFEITDFVSPFNAPPYALAGVDVYDDAGWVYEMYEEQDGDFTISLFPGSKTIRITANSFVDDTVYALYHVRNVWMACTITYNAKFYSGEVLISEYEKVVAYADGGLWGYKVDAWLYLDTRNNTVYEV